MNRLVNLADLPRHTKREIILGLINDTLAGRKTGFTISLDLKQPSEGFAVGGYKRGEIVVTPTWNREDKEDIVYAFLDDPLLQENKDVFVGGWLHEGNCIRDVSQIFTDREEAERVGRDRGEKAIFDLGKGEDIDL